MAGGALADKFRELLILASEQTTTLMDIANIIMMVLVGAVAGTLAARIMRGDNFGFIVNALLGIAGAVVGGNIFNFLKLTPGAGIVKVISETFGVNLPQNLVGMIVSATLGALIILWIARFLRIGRGR